MNITISGNKQGKRAFVPIYKLLQQKNWSCAFTDCLKLNKSEANGGSCFMCMYKPQQQYKSANQTQNRNELRST